MTHALVIFGTDNFAVTRAMSQSDAIECARNRSQLYPRELVSVVSLVDGSTVQSFTPQQVMPANLGDRAAAR
jgi:hypothetical protein